MKYRKIIFVITLFILLLQVIPVQGICYLFGINVFENSINDQYVCDNEDGDKDEDPVKIKKIEILYEHSMYAQIVCLQSVVLYKSDVKFFLPLNHSVEILIPPPNAI